VVFPVGLLPGDDWPAVDVRDAAATIVVGKGGTDVVVTVPGYKARELRGLAGGGEEHTVQLEPWPEVELVFAGMPALPPDTSLSAFLAPRASAQSGRYHSSSSRGSRPSLTHPTYRPVPVTNGRARLTVGEGPHDLLLLLKRENVLRSVRVTDAQPAELDPTAAGPIVSVSVPAASWTQAVQKLDELARQQDR